MSRKPPRSPQDKKALSYTRDRRNTYGENDKASRKAIPRRKAMENRQDRRTVAQSLAIIARSTDEEADLIESSARHDVNRVGGWVKSADTPLGTVVAKARAAREVRIERRLRLANTVGEMAEDDPETLTRMAMRFRRLSRWIARRYPANTALAKRFDQSADALELRAAALKPAS